MLSLRPTKSRDSVTQWKHVRRLSCGKENSFTKTNVKCAVPSGQSSLHRHEVKRLKET